ncbi:MAG TPA: DUF1570 domain-containing protein [Pyrinomonadaceae bacterium]|nr:DUF1570 domain-containing protein [Pyrinomonadaceae bacterium]
MLVRLFPAILCLSVVLTGTTAHAVSKNSDWRQLRTGNFNVIGNATEKEMIRVGTRLEHFRQAFRQIFAQLSVDSPVETNVVVFRNDTAFRPFKPRRPDGKLDEQIAGYFQSGQDANYVVISVGRTEAETFRTVFHEYVHFLVNSNVRGSAIPAWFNEGLAEYYQSFSMSGERKATVGTPNRAGLELLRKNRMMAPEDFFGTTNGELRALGNHSRSIFYAQAWLTMHYLMTKKKREQLDKFVEMSMKGRPSEQAFRDSFGTNYAGLDAEIRAHLEIGNLSGGIVDLEPISTVLPVSGMDRLRPAEVQAYLGDLLFRIGREPEAESYLRAALDEDPNLTIANTSMGMMLMYKKRLEEARSYLERAVEKGSDNFVALYQLAFLISQESKGEFGFVSSFSLGQADRIRDLLRRAIKMNPDFTESYELFAFVSLVSDDGFDEAVEGMLKAISLRPDDRRYAVRLAELYLRKNRFDDATRIASNAEKEAEDERVKDQARLLLDRINTKAALQERSNPSSAEIRTQDPKSNSTRFEEVALTRISESLREPTPEEIERKVKDMYFHAISKHLRKAGENEVRFVGRLERIECRGGKIEFFVNSDGRRFLFTSKDFQQIYLTSYVAEGGMAELGCGVRPVVPTAVLTYLPEGAGRGRFNGVLVSVEFVPSNFKVIDH